MQERLNWTVSKTVVAQATVGSNPTLSVLEIIGVCYVFYDSIGAVAQLGERIPRTDEVTGSNPVCSIIINFSERCRSWLNWHDWKSCVLFCSTVGSNPTLSASFKNRCGWLEISHLRLHINERVFAAWLC